MQGQDIGIDPDCGFKEDILKRVNDVSNATIVSVDEPGFNQRPFKLYAYASKGCDAVLRAPACTDNKSYSLLMAIGSDGRKHHAVRKGTTKSDVFANFLLGLPFPSTNRDEASVGEKYYRELKS